jgi:dynactin complex subunit
MVRKYCSTSRRQIQTLEAKLAYVNHRKQALRRQSVQNDNSFAHTAAVTKENQRLRGENNGLKDEVEELKAMVEVLRAQVGKYSSAQSDPSSESTSLTSS